MNKANPFHTLTSMARALDRPIRTAIATALAMTSLAAPTLRQAATVATVATGAAATGVWVLAHPPALDSVFGAPPSVFAYDPNLPPGAIQSDFCYAMNDDGNVMVVVNRFTGSVAYTSTIAGLESGTNEATSFDPSTALLYVVDQDTQPDRLVTVTLNISGTPSSVTEIGTGGLTTVTNPFTLSFGMGTGGNEGSGDNRVTGLTINPFNGVLYAVTNENYLFQIDKATGKVILGAMVGGTDFVTVPIQSLAVSGELEIEDLAFDPTTGYLYVVYENPRDSSIALGYVHRIDPSTGALIGSQLGPIGNAGKGNGGPNANQAETEGLSFGADGILYVSTGDAASGTSNDGLLIAIQQLIDNTNVQTNTLITQLPLVAGNRDYESLSCNAGAPFVLSINKTHTPTGVIKPGEPIVFTILVSNTGVFTSNAQVVDNVPSQIIVTDWTCSINPDVTGGCTPPSGNTNAVAVSGFIPPLTGTMTVLITGTVRLGSNGTITNSATVSNTNGIEDTSNNTGTTPIDIVFPGSIGNYVWVDENGDGQQDAGEPGLPNVIVQIVTGSGTVLTTTTDTNGGYAFHDLPPGTYTVSVQSGSLPAGAVQTTNPVNPNADFGNQTQPYVVNLPPGGENLTADFGYNFVPPGDSPNPPPGATGAIGDRVWRDADGDGFQDPGELGFGGVTVELLVDSNNDGVYGGSGDAPAVVTVTDPDGSYLFDGLPPGAYVVNIPTPPPGYTQTGDPDHFGTTGAPNDNRTTVPIVLGPGDVFLNADFGYRPPNSASFDIGDTVFVDTNANGTLDGSDYGVAGVTVALLDSGGNVIATTQTDATGSYLFTGVPDGTYTVWVNDTDNVLQPLVQTSTPNNAVNGGQPCGTCNDRNTLTITGADNLNQDFGYAPAGQTPTTGLIGDTIFLDRNGNNLPDPGEGIENAQVILTYPNGVTVATNTDENGHYYFGNLPPGTFTVTVNTATLPPGLTNSVDPDGGGNSQSVVNLPAGGINLIQDFGYIPSTANPAGSIGNLVWEDTNADGVKQPAEAGIGGVTLDLYEDVDGDGLVGPGDRLIGSTATDPTGAYLFSNLPTSQGGVNYIVDVTDDASVLGGYWHSLGAPNTDDNSQTDPLAVTLTSANPNFLAADFGYYVKPGALGNFVWNDLNGNGVQDLGEPGLNGVTVTLVITYPNGDVSTVTTLSGDDPSTVPVEQGWYGFGNLLLDENYRQSSGTSTPAPNQPAYVISVATPTGFSPSPTGAGTPMTDSDNNGGAPGDVTMGQNNVVQNANPGAESNPNAGLDFGFVANGSIGDFVWLDLTPNGQQDAGEPGVPGVTVTLYVNGIPTATTVTDGGGIYTFTNLPTGPTNQYSVAFTIPAPFTFTLPNTGPDATDSDAVPTTVPQVGATSVFTLTAGQVLTTVDAGIRSGPPTSIDLMRFSAAPVSAAKCGNASGADCVSIAWRTASESGVLGFRLLRAATADGSVASRLAAVEVTPQLIAANGEASDYAWTDSDTKPGLTYTYWLVEVDVNGRATEFGPVATTVGGSVVGDDLIVATPMPILRPR